MSKPQYKRIEEEINSWRDREGLTQSDLAVRVDASQATVSRVIRGQTDNPQLLDNLCTLAGVDVHKKDPSYCPILATALNQVWDGTDEQGQAIALLLLAANSIAAGRVR